MPVIHDFSKKNLEELNDLRQTVIWLLCRSKVEKDKRDYAEVLQQIKDEIWLRTNENQK